MSFFSWALNSHSRISKARMRVARVERKPSIPHSFFYIKKYLAGNCIVSRLIKLIKLICLSEFYRQLPNITVPLHCQLQCNLQQTRKNRSGMRWVSRAETVIDAFIYMYESWYTRSSASLTRSLTRSCTHSCTRSCTRQRGAGERWIAQRSNDSDTLTVLTI